MGIKSEISKALGITIGFFIFFVWIWVLLALYIQQGTKVEIIPPIILEGLICWTIASFVISILLGLLFGIRENYLIKPARE